MSKYRFVLCLSLALVAQSCRGPRANAWIVNGGDVAPRATAADLPALTGVGVCDAVAFYRFRDEEFLRPVPSNEVEIGASYPDGSGYRDQGWGRAASSLGSGSGSVVLAGGSGDSSTGAGGGDARRGGGSGDARRGGGAGGSGTGSGGGDASTGSGAGATGTGSGGSDARSGAGFGDLTASPHLKLQKSMGPRVVALGREAVIVLRVTSTTKRRIVETLVVDHIDPRFEVVDAGGGEVRRTADGTVVQWRDASGLDEGARRDYRVRVRLIVPGEGR